MSGSQKFISRNRAPRVQIEYDVEVYGAQKKVQLPFVMGVMSDLSGKSEVPTGSVADRKFLEIDIDNFDSRMKAMKPRAAFSVPNTLSGEGNLSVDLVFEKMSDFSPAEIARKVEPLRKLLEARTQLENLMTYMDGKAGAEELIERLVANPDQLRALALGAGKHDAQDAAFAAMKATAPEAAPEAKDDSANILAAMAAKAPVDAAAEDTSADVLSAMAAAAPVVEANEASVTDVLAGMAKAPAEPDAEPDESGDILAGMAASAPEETAPDTGVEDALAGLASSAVEALPEQDISEDVLAGLAAEIPDETAPDTSVSDTLEGLAADAVLEAAPKDTSADVLAGLAQDAPKETAPDTSVKDLLAGMATENTEKNADVPANHDDGADILAALADSAPEPERENTTTDETLAEIAATANVRKLVAEERVDVLANLAETTQEEAPADTTVNDALSALAADVVDAPEEKDGIADLLAGMAEETVEDAPEAFDVDDLLNDLAADVAVDEADPSAGILSELADTPLEEVTPVEDPSGILDDLIEATTEAVEAESDLDGLLADIAEAAPEDEEDSDLDALLEGIADGEADNETGDGELDELLAGMADVAPDGAVDDDGLDDLLVGMANAEPEAGDEALSALLAEDNGELDALLGEDDDLDSLLAGTDETVDDDLEALLGGATEAVDEDDNLDVLLTPDDDAPEDDLDALLGLDDDLDSLLASADETVDDDLDALLGDVFEAESEDDDDDLDALLALADNEPEGGDLDSLLVENDDEADDLDALLGLDDDLSDLLESAEPEAVAPPPKPKKPAFTPNFGNMSATKLQFKSGSRRKFRIAVLGDFSGRGNKGALETGAALGKRKAFKLDFDTMEDVIMRFRTTLTLPLGNDGSAVEVELNELDDLHPDELFENVDMFNELNMLRRDLKSGRNFEQNVERMKAWGGDFGDFKAISKKRGIGADAPADLRLTDFQNLIGDSTPKPEASAASDLISRIIGPHVVAAADNGAEAMIAAVDEALSTAMSSVLHHPDFQTIEAAWRSIELLGRRVEASAELEVVVYDVSVEEFAADLAAQEDISQSGLYDMLVEKPMMDESGGPLSAVVGLYTWEETPTHAEILARMARIAAQMDAPFISAISTGFMGVKPEDRHPLVQKTWNALGSMPEAKYLGLATPRFMLRMPYGKKTEPLDRFDYEEFTVKEGMRSMLMANPALLVAVLLAETKARQGGDMSLGSIMSLNDMPFHYMTDQYGDQVALPCTERLLTVSSAADVVARGFMPVLSVQGQNIVKLGSFQAVGGGELLGIWAGDAAKDMKSGKARMETSVGMSGGAKQVGAPPKAVDPRASEAGEYGDDDLDIDLGGSDDDLDLDFGGDDLDLELDLGLDDDDGMDALLAGFGDDDDDDDDVMDADLAALLGDL